jgi:four helix bundle protein
MTSDYLKTRTKRFALPVIDVANQLTNNWVGWTLSGQVIRSNTSIAANYRAACRAKSDKDFIAKMETVIEEADETKFWIEMIHESNTLKNDDVLQRLDQEANELVAIFVSSVRTVKRRIETSARKS